MTIDLSQFVDKEVIVTLRDKSIRHGIVQGYSFLLSNFYSYSIEFVGVTGHWYYSNDGRYYTQGSHIRDIVDIQLKRPQKTMTKLSESTVRKLADVLTPEAVKYIQESEKYAEFMMNMFSEFISQQMGEMDGILKDEIRFLLMDRIYFVPQG
jgi:hypothetical protein